MTTLVYNGVAMFDCETLSFDQTIEYDESKTDPMFSRWRIRVASNLVTTHYPSNPSLGINPVQGGTVVNRMHDLQARLSEPRQDFWFLIEQAPQSDLGSTTPLDQPLIIATGQVPGSYDLPGGGGPVVVDANIVANPFSNDSETVLYGVGGASANVPRLSVMDCNNGPKPQDVKIVKIIGGRSLRVEFDIEVCRVICDATVQDLKPNGDDDQGLVEDSTVLSNRWSIEESKDENWITSRSLHGTLRVANKTVLPHLMRFLTLPPLLKGYKRIRQSFASDPTDLVLKYRVDDRQVHAAPPAPAIAWQAHHTESATGTEGTIKTGECSVRLTGRPGCDKQQLIGLAGKIIVNRIRGLANLSSPTDFSTILKNSTITDVMHEPTIEMRVQVRYTDDSYKALGLRVTRMGTTLDEEFIAMDPFNIDDYEPDVNPVPLAFDSTRPAGIFSCYLQRPCSVWHDVPDGVPQSNYPVTPVRPPITEYDRDTYGDSYEYPSGHTIPEDVVERESDTAFYSYPYTYIELESEYAISTGYIGLPMARDDDVAVKTTELIKLHGRFASRILTLSASREGSPPVIPSMTEVINDPNGAQEVLVDWRIKYKEPKQGATGADRTWHTEAQYIYRLEKSPWQGDVLHGLSSLLDTNSSDPALNSFDLASNVDTTSRYFKEYP